MENRLFSSLSAQSAYYGSIYYGSVFTHVYHIYIGLLIITVYH